MIHARILTFRTDRRSIGDVIPSLDLALAGYRAEPGFKGLLCLEHGGARHEVVVITLWDAAGIASTARRGEDARALTVLATDAEATSRDYQVLGFVPGTTGLDDHRMPEADRDLVA